MGKSLVSRFFDSRCSFYENIIHDSVDEYLYIVLLLLGYKMNKRVGGLTEFQFEPLTSGRSLSVTITITGWLSETQGIASTACH